MKTNLKGILTFHYLVSPCLFDRQSDGRACQSFHKCRRHPDANACVTSDEMHARADDHEHDRDVCDA